MLSIDDKEVVGVLQAAFNQITTIKSHEELLERHCDNIEAITGINSKDIETMLRREYVRRYPLCSDVLPEVSNTSLSKVIGELK